MEVPSLKEFQDLVLKVSEMEKEIKILRSSRNTPLLHYTREQAAGLLKMNVDTLTRHLKDPNCCLRGYKDGKSWKVESMSVKEYQDKHHFKAA